MASLSDIRQAVQTKVETVSGFKLVPFPPSYFRRVQNTLAHKGFTIDVTTSNDEGERMRGTGSIYLSSTVRVIFAYRLRPKDIIVDYDLSMDIEEDVIKAVLGSYAGIQAGMQVRYNRSTRDVPDSMEYMTTTLEFTILHTI
jgi:hypothetical protein